MEFEYKSIRIVAKNIRRLNKKIRKREKKGWRFFCFTDSYKDYDNFFVGQCLFSRKNQQLINKEMTKKDIIITILQIIETCVFFYFSYKISKWIIIGCMHLKSVGDYLITGFFLVVFNIFILGIWGCCMLMKQKKKDNF